ncbi:MAG: hypothetical protein M3R27_14750 [Bacteroidota bacterium]|nr:hypothetical protein [Bacteroidota bacterium]
MKNLFLGLSMLISVFSVSCKKESELQPSTPAAPKTIKVEYVIQITSAQAVTSYLFPNSDGKLEMVTETVTRNNKVVSFEYNSGNFFYVEAANSSPSHLPVQVQLYIDGKMVAEHSTSNPSMKAIAQGNY